MIDKSGLDWLRLQRQMMLQNEEKWRKCNAEYLAELASFNAYAERARLPRDSMAYREAKAARFALQEAASDAAHYRAEVAARAALITAYEAYHRMTGIAGATRGPIAPEEPARVPHLRRAG